MFEALDDLFCFFFFFLFLLFVFPFIAYIELLDLKPSLSGEASHSILLSFSSRRTMNNVRENKKVNTEQHSDEMRKKVFLV